jgi:Domain of unknown function (DUF151)
MPRRPAPRARKRPAPADLDRAGARHRTCPPPPGHGPQLARPLGSDLSARLVQALGGTVREVRIDRLSEGTYYAVIVIDGPQGAIEVDARPSDALTLALVVGALSRPTAPSSTRPSRMRPWPKGSPSSTAKRPSAPKPSSTRSPRQTSARTHPSQPAPNLSLHAAWSALGRRGTGNRWFSAGTSGQCRRTRIAGHSPVSAPTSAGRAAWGRVQVPLRHPH